MNHLTAKSVEAIDIIASIKALSTTRNAWRLQESHKQHSYGVWLSLLPTLLSTPFVNYLDLILEGIATKAFGLD